MSKKKTNTVQVHMPVMVDALLLSEHASNTQRQSPHMYKELRQSIRSHGFDEQLIVIPNEDSEGFWIVAGNHRFRAGLAEGMTEFPVVVRHDWSNIEANIQSVRRNYIRGAIDKDAFTAAVNSLSEEASLPVTAIMEQMGFESTDAFQALYKEEQEQEQRAVESAKEAASSDVGVVKLLDDIGTVVSSLVAKYGHTIPSSFLIFPLGKHNHMYVAVNPSLKKSMQAIAQMALSNNLDINVALAGILAIGLDETNFLNNEGKDEIMLRVDEDDDGDEDLELV